MDCFKFNTFSQFRFIFLIIFPIIFSQFKSTFAIGTDRTINPTTTRVNETSVDDLTILLLGGSGAGKSTTINLLLNQEIAPVGSITSTTTTITDFYANIPNSNSRIRFTDTPGIGDTRGLEYDAQLLATLDEYFINARMPDIVLICARLDDNRFHGEGSGFVKILRALSLVKTKWLHIETDETGSKTKSNVILLLTHFSSLSLREAKNPQNKIKRFQEAIKNFTLLPVESIPVVLGENRGIENELVEIDGTEKGFLLANGDIYPNNLYKTFKQILNSPIKLKLVDILASNITLSAQSSSPAVNRSDSMTQFFLNSLLRLDLNQENTQISQKLKSIFEQLNTQTQKIHPATLTHLQSSLHLRLVTNETDVPTSISEIPPFIRHLGLDNDGFRLLETAIELKLPKLFPSFQTNFPYSLNYMNVFDFTLFYPNPTIGYKIPTSYSCTMVNTVSRKVQSVSTISYLYPVIKCAIVNPLKETYFSSTFLDTLRKLPSLDVTNSGVDLKIMSAWKTFFDTYGTEVISEFEFGGSLVISHVQSTSIAANDVNSDNNLNFSQYINCQLSINGGSKNLHTDACAVFFRDNEKLYKNWKISVFEFPAFLPESKRFISLENLIHQIDPTCAGKIKKAEYYLEQNSKSFEKVLLTEIVKIQNSVLKEATLVSRTTEETVQITSKLLLVQTKLKEMQMQLLTEKQNLGQISSANSDCKASLSICRNEIQAEQSNSGTLKSQVEVSANQLTYKKSNLAVCVARTNQLNAIVRMGK